MTTAYYPPVTPPPAPPRLGRATPLPAAAPAAAPAAVLQPPPPAPSDAGRNGRERVDARSRPRCPTCGYRLCRCTDRERTVVLEDEKPRLVDLPRDVNQGVWKDLPDGAPALPRAETGRDDKPLSAQALPARPASNTPDPGEPPPVGGKNPAAMALGKLAAGRGGRPKSHMADPLRPVADLQPLLKTVQLAARATEAFVELYTHDPDAGDALIGTIKRRMSQC